MKTLFVGSTSGNRCSLYYFSSFVRLGGAVIPYDPHYFSGGNALENLRVRLGKGPTKAMREERHRFLVQMCRNNQFDLVFVMSENFVGHETIQEIRQEAARGTKTPPVFLYHSHDNNFFDGILKPTDFWETMRAYDVVFTTKSQNVAKYQGIGQANAVFLPSAYEPTTHRPITAAESRIARPFEVTFVGTYDRSRDPILEAVGWNRLHVWGDNWRRSPHYSQQADRITPRAIYYFEFPDVISHSRCSLGLLREEAQDLHTQRTFEIPACGGLQFAPRNEEILSFFEDKKEIVCFSSKEELRDLLTYYLSHEKEAERIRKAGYERTINGGHSYQERVETMLQVASKVSARRWPGVPSDSFGGKVPKISGASIPV